MVIKFFYEDDVEVPQRVVHWTMKLKDWVFGILLLVTNVMFLTTFLPQIPNAIPLLYLEFFAFLYLWVERSVSYLYQRAHEKKGVVTSITVAGTADQLPEGCQLDPEQGSASSPPGGTRPTTINLGSKNERLFYPRTQISPSKAASRVQKPFFAEMRTLNV